jgi:hypothetical protein
VTALKMEGRPQGRPAVFLAMGGKLYMPGGQPLIMFPGLYISLILGTEKKRHRWIGGEPRRLHVDSVQQRVAQWKAAA